MLCRFLAGMFEVASTSRLLELAENGESKQFGYGQLSKAIDELKKELADVKGQLIGISMKKSAAIVAVIAGILETNNAFIYLPYDAPSSYIRNQCEALEMAILITETDLDYSTSRRKLSIFSRILYMHVFENVISTAWPEPMAYMMQTSGTTGRPKRVFVPFSCIMPNILDFRSRFACSAEDRIFFSTALSFDPSIVELFLALFVGTELLIIPDSWRSIPGQLSTVLLNYEPTIVQMTPSLLRLLSPETVSKVLNDRSKIRILLLGGEDFPIQLIGRLRHSANKTKIYNLYGTTEVSCWASAKLIDERCYKENRVDIGELLLETGFSIDPDGELFITGGRKCCINGVWSNGSRIGTGDLVIEEEGRLFFVGRSDDQIKIRGMRLNTHQIEKMAENSDETDCCAVLVHKDQLVLLLRLPESGKSIAASLAKFLADNAPPHWQPSRIIEVDKDKWPTNRHGKTDRKKLTQLVDEYFKKIRRHEDFGLICQESLGIDISEMDQSVSVRSLGIDSFKAVQLSLEMGMDSGDQSDLMSLLMDEKTTLGHLMEFCGKVRIQRRTEVHQKNGIESPVSEVNCPDEKFRMTFNWKWNSGKCIDASPLIVETDVIIGSHSGRMARIDIETGMVKWQIQLPDRLEATAAISGDGQVMAIGCFDSFAYFLNAQTGDTLVKFQTGDAIKSTAVFLPDSCSALIGSHDRFFYRLDYKAKKCIWRISVHGAILAPSTLTIGGSIAMVATLNGRLFAINVDDGKIIWEVQLDRPVFASPVILDERFLLVGDVRGTVTVLDSTNGNMLTSIKVDGALFNNAVEVQKLNERFRYFLLGTQNGQILLLRIDLNGNREIRVVQRIQLDGAIVKAPFIIGTGMARLILVQTTIGNLYRIRLNEGFTTVDPAILTTTRRNEEAEEEEQRCLILAYLLHRYPGETFGRPAIVPDRTVRERAGPGGSMEEEKEEGYSIIVGSRDDMLYCHHLLPRRLLL